MSQGELGLKISYWIQKYQTSHVGLEIKIFHLGASGKREGQEKP